MGVEAGSCRRYRNTLGADPKRLQRLLSLPSADNRAPGGRPAGVVAKGTPKTIAGCFTKSIVHATRTLDVPTPFTPHSELYRNFKASRCIPPEQWNLVEHLTGHGQPFLAFRPCPPNSRPPHHIYPPHPCTILPPREWQWVLHMVWC